MKYNLTYPQQIKWRIRLLWAALAAMLILMVVIGEMGLRDSRVVTGYAYTCSNQMFWGGMIYIVARIIINKRRLQDRQKLKAQQLRERDERNQYLHRMSGGCAMDAMLLITYVASVIAGCFSNAAFYTAASLLLCAVLLKSAAYLAYSHAFART